MNTPHQTGSPALSAGVQPSPVVPSTPWLAGKLSLAVGLTLLAGVLSSSAANITMTATDAGGTTSFNTAGHWSNLAAPSAGNAYVVSGATVNSIVLRTPNPTSSGNNYIFAGDSLSIDFGGTLLGKIGNNTGGSAYYIPCIVCHFKITSGKNPSEILNPCFYMKIFIRFWITVHFYCKS